MRHLDHVKLTMEVLARETLEMRHVAHEKLLMVHCDHENPRMTHGADEEQLMSRMVHSKVTKKPSGGLSNANIVRSTFVSTFFCFGFLTLGTK